MKNAMPSEQTAVIGVIDPDAYAAAAYSTGYFALKNWERIQAIVMAGTLGASATINAKLTVHTDSSGTGPLDVVGAAITALTQAGTDSDKQAIINLDVGKISHAAQYTHGRLTVTVAVADSDMSAVVLGFGPRYAPASDSDASTVDEIVNV